MGWSETADPSTARLTVIGWTLDGMPGSRSIWDRSARIPGLKLGDLGRPFGIDVDTTKLAQKGLIAPVGLLRGIELTGAHVLPRRILRGALALGVQSFEKADQRRHLWRR